MVLGTFASCNKGATPSNPASSDKASSQASEQVGESDKGNASDVNDANDSEDDDLADSNDDADSENSDNEDVDNNDDADVDDNNDADDNDSDDNDADNNDNADDENNNDNDVEEDVCDHEGGEDATCITESICDICDEPYGGLDSGNHEGEAVYESTETTHKLVYTCCGASSEYEDEENHTFLNGVCSVCEYECKHKNNNGSNCAVCGAFMSHNYVNGKCTECGLDKNGKTTLTEGSTIFFGSYPQKAVKDSSLVNTLNGKAGSLPTASSAKSWTSYGYNENQTMWYIDVEYSNAKYRGVYYTKARPTHLDSNTGDQQTANGYAPGSVYWFKYEPIKWTVLEVKDGSALVLSELIIDAQPYQGDVSFSSNSDRNQPSYNVSAGTPSGTAANNYEYSYIRNWLITDFFNTAFDSLQKEIVKTTLVENNDKVVGDYSNGNKFFCQDTEDKIFLLSKGEVKKYQTFNDNSERMKTVTDYAKAQGAFANASGGDWWWMRTPTYQSKDSSGNATTNKSDLAHNIKIDGSIFSSNVYLSTGGVVPAMWISI